MISAILFDYDGVLTTDKTGSLTTCRYISQATGIDVSAVQAAFRLHNEALTLGKTTHAQIWPSICRALGRDLRFGLLQAAFESTPMNAGMFALARSLKGKYSLGIITDNKKDRIDHLKSFQGLGSLFDPIVVSSEVGSSKGSEEMFRVALNHLGLEAGTCVFIDNHATNLAIPSALGMRTIFHDDEKNDIAGLVETLAALGVAVEMQQEQWTARLARENDAPSLESLVPTSARVLQAPHYTPAQLDAALGPIFGVDRQLIRDGTYFVVEDDGLIVGCGGWSKRRSLFGGDGARSAEDPELDPARDAARIRAFFVHPSWARRGIGRTIMAACERAIVTAGFRTVDIVATLTGEPLYASFGYKAVERFDIPMRGGLSLPAVRMTKDMA